MPSRLALALAGCLLAAGCSGGGGPASNGASGPAASSTSSSSTSAPAPTPQSTAAAAAAAAQRAKASAAYVSSVATWRRRSLAPVVKQVRRARFSDLPVTTRRETPGEASRQAQRCTSLAQTRLALSALDAPALPEGATARASALDTALTRQLAAYRSTAGSALEQVTGYCTYYVKAIAVDRTRGLAYEAVLAAQVPKGACRQADDAQCIPTTQPRLRAFATAYERFLVTDYDAQIRSNDGETGPCRLKDYARFCALYEQQRPALLAAQRAVVAALKAGRTGTALRTVLDRADAVNAAAVAKRNALETSLFPGVNLSDSDAHFANELRVLRRYERVLASAKAPTAA